MDLLSSDSEEEKEKKVSKKTSKKTKSDESSSDQLRVNQRFASEFERRERYKELQRAKEVLQNDDDVSDSESDESEDEDAELLSPGLDVKILQTINLLKKKDPKIYDPSTKWFSDPSSDEESNNSESDNDASKKKMRYKDVLRQQLINDRAGDSDEDNLGAKRDMENIKKGQLLYDREQEEIRKQFLKAAKNVDERDDDSSNDNLLNVKQKSAAEREEEERAYQQALEEMKQLAEKEKEADDTAFLHQFLANKMWKDPASKKMNVDIDDEEDYEEDEKAFDEAERFESKYNFRFEELQAGQHSSDDEDMTGNVLIQQSRNQVIGHARNVEDSLRRVDDKRKKQRESRKEKKEKEKRQKEAEIKRLKNLKKQELQERLAKISEMGGLKELGIDENFLEEDWDPEKHEKLMTEQFNDEYYEGHHDDDLVAILKGHSDDFDEDEHYNLLEDEEGNVIVDDYDATRNDEDVNDNYFNENNNDDFADEGENTKENVSKLMDEYYALDYEDLIAGMPCRFKYRQVEPDDYGLSTEDILLAGDKELNDYVSLKKLAPYDTRYNVSGGSGKDLSKKRKRLRTLLRERLEAEEALAAAKATKRQANTTVDTENEEKKKRKRRKRKHREGDDEAAAEEGKEEDSGEKVISKIREITEGEEEPKKMKREQEKKEKPLSESKTEKQEKREEKVAVSDQKQVNSALGGEKRKRKRQKHNKNKKEQPWDAKQHRLDLYK